MTEEDSTHYDRGQEDMKRRMVKAFVSACGATFSVDGRVRIEEALMVLNGVEVASE